MILSGAIAGWNVVWIFLIDSFLRNSNYTVFLSTWRGEKKILKLNSLIIISLGQKSALFIFKYAWSIPRPILNAELTPFVDSFLTTTSRVTSWEDKKDLISSSGVLTPLIRPIYNNFLRIVRSILGLSWETYEYILLPLISLYYYASEICFRWVFYTDDHLFIFFVPYVLAGICNCCFDEFLGRSSVCDLQY